MSAGTHLGLTPRYGRAPRGQRVVGVVPRNRGPNVTVLAAMSVAGITAAMTMTGAADGEVVALFGRRILLPTLQPRPDRPLGQPQRAHQRRPAPAPR